MSLPDFRGSGKNISKMSSKIRTEVPLFKEMRNIGFSRSGIFSFSTIGVGIWAVLVWLFVARYNRINDSSIVLTNTENIKKVNIIILCFHLLTMLFAFAEGYHLSRYVFLTWMTVGLALSATLLNAGLVGGSVLTGSAGYENPNFTEDVASLVLQCFANALMFAYIIHIIRHKSKTMY